jgi:hypothetical protein
LSSPVLGISFELSFTGIAHALSFPHLLTHILIS